MMTETAFLQLRWTENDGQHGYAADMNWLCHYELVLPLDELDVRREDANGIDVRSRLIIPIKPPSGRGSDRAPCADGVFDTPFRDGAHAGWDSAKLGNIPIFVIAPDGTQIPEPEDHKRERMARCSPTPT